MATKDNNFQCNSNNLVKSSTKDSNDQYGNLNLNLNHKCSSIIKPTHSNSNSIDIGKRNTENATLNLKTDEANSSGLKSKNDKNSLNIQTSKPFKTANFKEDSEDQKEKRWKNGNKNSDAKTSSTLSLHIAAYENSVEAASNMVSSKKDEISTKKTISLNDDSTGLPECLQDSFEIPRQQNEERCDPEVMQFKASQKLLSSRELMISEGSSKVEVKVEAGENSLPSEREEGVPVFEGQNVASVDGEPDDAVNELNDSDAADSGAIVEKEADATVQLKNVGGLDEEVFDPIVERTVEEANVKDKDNVSSPASPDLSPVSPTPIHYINPSMIPTSSSAAFHHHHHQQAPYYRPILPRPMYFQDPAYPNFNLFQRYSYDHTAASPAASSLNTSVFSPAYQQHLHQHHHDITSQSVGYHFNVPRQPYNILRSQYPRPLMSVRIDQSQYFQQPRKSLLGPAPSLRPQIQPSSSSKPRFFSSSQLSQQPRPSVVPSPQLPQQPLRYRTILSSSSSRQPPPQSNPPRAQSPKEFVRRRFVPSPQQPQLQPPIRPSPRGPSPQQQFRPPSNDPLPSQQTSSLQRPSSQQSFMGLSSHRQALNLGVNVEMKKEVEEDLNTTPATTTIKSEEATNSTMNDNPQMQHYPNITEQMPEDDDFVNNLLNQMGQQFPVPQMVQPIRLRIPSQPLSTEPQQVEEHRQYRVGNDKRGKSQARLWIDTPTDETKVFLYRHSAQHSVETCDVFVCIQCSRHSRTTKFEIRRVANGHLELWEQATHYPSCYRTKTEIEAIQAKYDRRRSMNASIGSTDNSFNTSRSSLPSRSTQSSRPKNNDYHYNMHRIVPKTDYIFGVNEKGSLKSRILVRDETHRHLGRVYSFHPAKRNDKRIIFYCRNCNPRKYVPVMIQEEQGEFTVREAPFDRHESKCAPTNFDDLIEKQRLLEEKLERRGIRVHDDSNIAENGEEFRARHRSPTIGIASREGTRTPPPVYEPPAYDEPAPQPSARARRALSRSRSPRSRSRSPLAERSRSRTPSNSNASFLSTASASGGGRRGRRPDKALMTTVSGWNWRCRNPYNIGDGSRLIILSETDPTMGREFQYCEECLDGGSFFNCENCSRLTANRQRTKGYLNIENGRIEVREGKHYPTCKPYPLRNLPPALPENERDDQEMGDVEERVPTPAAAKVTRSPAIRTGLTRTIPVPTSAPSSSPSLSPELGVAGQKRDGSDPLPTPPPSHQIKSPFPADSTLMPSPEGISFIPKILPANRTIYYNVPSSSQMRAASKILGLEYNKDGQVFWNNTLQWISEFRGSSQPTEIRKIHMEKISGFASLAIFMTGNELYGFEVQKAVKSYFYEHFAVDKKLPDDVILETLVTNELTDIHLAIFARMINGVIGVFDGSNLKMFGETECDQSPTMLLQKTGKSYSPVIKIYA